MRTRRSSDTVTDKSTSRTASAPRRLWLSALTLTGLLFATSIVADIATAAEKTGLPLPRFVSLRKDEVNVRTGPGIRYPVEWVFTYRNMPVEVVAEFKTWRKVRDWQGTLGWVHPSMLSRKRWIIVRTRRQSLHRINKSTSPVIARIEAKVLGRLKRCVRGWCQVDIAGFLGWIERTGIWGVYTDERVE